MSTSPTAVAPFEDANGVHHRFGSVRFRGVEWDLSHLKPFGKRIEMELKTGTIFVDVVFFHSCHCFTRSFSDTAGLPLTPKAEVYSDGRETRRLDLERYTLSRALLPGIVSGLESRQIRIASGLPNFFTIEVTAVSGRTVNYAVFFEVERDNTRKGRLLVRIQSAYPIEELPKRMRNAGKVKFATLLRAAYEGRTIRG